MFCQEHNRRKKLGPALPCVRSIHLLLILILLLGLSTVTRATVGGAISGTVKDSSGAVVPKATVTATNTDTGVRQVVATNDTGSYSFPSLPVGHYDLDITVAGFRPYRRAGIAIDVNSLLLVDAVLEVGELQETITVQESPVQVETASTQMGEVITAEKVTAMPLNGRSYTDLLALQPGVLPVTTITSSTVQGLGQGVFSPSGDLNPGTLSINGQRESANGFVVNGADAEEDGAMAAAIIPNLDSIAEFRILTNNFDAEHGKYSGGVDQRHYEIRNQPASWGCFRFPAKHRSGLAQFFLSHSRCFPSKPVRRHDRRSHRAEQNLLLRRLSRHTAEYGHGHRPHPGPLDARPGR